MREIDISTASRRAAQNRRLPRRHVRHLRDQRAIDQVVGNRAATLVVHDEDIVQRTVNDVEPDVRTPLPGVIIVLNERVDEHCRGKAIVHTRGQQVRFEFALRQIDVVLRVIERCVQPVVGSPRRSGSSISDRYN